MDDVNAVTGTPEITDSTVPMETPVAEGATPTVTEGQETPSALFEYGGQQYDEQKIVEAIEALQNKSKWSSELSKKGEELNMMREIMEQYRQQGMSQQPQPAPMQQEQTPINGEMLQKLIFEQPDQAMNVIGGLIQQAVSQAVGQQSQTEQIRSKFLSEFSDYQQKVATPEVQQVMAENPGYNQVHAYLINELRQARAQVAEAEKQGFRKGEQQTINNMKAKGALKVLTGGGSPPIAPTQSGPMTHQQLLESITQKLETARRGA